MARQHYQLQNLPRLQGRCRGVLGILRLHRNKSLRAVARSHVIAWRKNMDARQLAPASIRRKLSALSSLFDYLCERNAVLGNPVDGVKRPTVTSNEGSTPAVGDAAAAGGPPPRTRGKGVWC
jgi:integrase/recombinase XerD